MSEQKPKPPYRRTDTMAGIESNPIPYLQDCFEISGHRRLVQGFKECSVTVENVKVRRQKEGYKPMVSYRLKLADGTVGSLTCAKFARWIR